VARARIDDRNPANSRFGDEIGDNPAWRFGIDGRLRRIRYCIGKRGLVPVPVDLPPQGVGARDESQQAPLWMDDG
jgi:hypothetical protein